MSERVPLADLQREAGEVNELNGVVAFCAGVLAEIQRCKSLEDDRPSIADLRRLDSQPRWDEDDVTEVFLGIVKSMLHAAPHESLEFAHAVPDPAPKFEKLSLSSSPSSVGISFSVRGCGWFWRNCSWAAAINRK